LSEGPPEGAIEQGEMAEAPPGTWSSPPRQSDQSAAQAAASQARMLCRRSTIGHTRPVGYAPAAHEGFFSSSQLADFRGPPNCGTTSTIAPGTMALAPSNAAHRGPPGCRRTPIAVGPAALNDWYMVQLAIRRQPRVPPSTNQLESPQAESPGSTVRLSRPTQSRRGSNALLGSLVDAPGGKNSCARGANPT
jgi:hypothetical protein